MQLHQIYRPIIATPFRCTEDYMEFPACDVLKPYICCFWGTRNPIKKAEGYRNTGIVIPDTCMDIMFTVDVANKSIRSRFCGIDDRLLVTHEGYDSDKMIFQFAIRFYAWGVHWFSEESLCGVKGNFFDAGYHFSKLIKELEPLVMEITNIDRLIPLVELVLFKHLKERRKSTDVSQAVYQMLRKRGNISSQELCRDVLISERQLERVFKEYMGCSPKNMASMVRFQYLWRDILYDKQFHILDAVDKYGYSDQAHLSHDFKKYYSMNIGEARKYAVQNVGNIQERFVKT